jgi:hypothetical protein
MAELGHKDLSGRVIEAAINVHKALGPGFLETVYEAALCVELDLMEIDYERQKIGSFDFLTPVQRSFVFHKAQPRSASQRQKQRARWLVSRVPD